MICKVTKFQPEGDRRPTDSVAMRAEMSQSMGATWGVVSSKRGVGRCRGGPRDVGDVASVDQP